MTKRAGIPLFLASVIAALLVVAVKDRGNNCCSVLTESGWVAGTTSAGVISWKGLPYAASTGGFSRWKVPAPAVPWTDVKRAAAFGPPCMQMDLEEGVIGSEDCLTLNIWRRSDASILQPVLVVIHGGSFVRGSGSLDFYDGTKFARTAKTVVVTINYRLGPFGFLSLLPFRDVTSFGEAYANFGIHDQIAALEWVKRNIAAFGGDPERITLYGFSAGSASVQALSNSRRSSELLAAASMSSGAVWSFPGAYEVAPDHKLFAEHAGCIAIDTVGCLREKPADVLLKASSGKAWLPIIDGEIISTKTLKPEEESSTLPLLIGYSAREYSWWNVPEDAFELPSREAVTRTYSPSEYATVVQDWLKSESPSFLRLYPLDRYSDSRNAFASALSDTSIACSTRAHARRHSRPTAPTWLYIYSRTFDSARWKSGGAFHGAELFALFQNLPDSLVFSQADEEFAAMITRYWTRFVATGNPNGGTDPLWPTYDPTSQTALVLDSETRLDQNDRAEECAFWQRRWSVQ